MGRAASIVQRLASPGGKLAAAIWQQTGSLEAIEGEGVAYGDRERLVQEMTNRFLVHCPPSERHRIFALALLRRPDAELWQAMLANGEGVETRGLLDDLARRYDFIFTHEGWLHDKVRTFLREALRAPAERSTARSLSERAWRWCEARLAERGGTWTWERRLDSERWVERALDMWSYRLWWDVEAAWEHLPALLLAGIAYDRAFARSLLDLATELEEGDSRTRRRQIALLRSLTIFPWSAQEHDEAVRVLHRLARQGAPPVQEEAELLAILRWAEAKVRLERDDDDARTAGRDLIALMSQLDPSWERLRENVAEALYDAGRKVLWPQGTASVLVSPEAVAFFEAAEQGKSWGESFFWNVFLVALLGAGRIDDAVWAGRKAIRLDPDDARAYTALGLALDGRASWRRRSHSTSTPSASTLTMPALQSGQRAPSAGQAGGGDHTVRARHPPRS